MKLLDVIAEEAVYNIIGHCMKCWDYTYPTGTALEEAVFRGLKAYYENSYSLGAPNTIVDVKKDTDAFDIKGGKKLSYLKKMSKSTNLEENIFIEQILPNTEKINVRIPKSIMTMIQRPNVDMENWRGDPNKIISAAISDYKNFASTTTKKANCNSLYSLVVLYGEDKAKKYRSIFITLEEFVEPEIVSTKHHLKQDKSYSGYNGFDKDGKLVYALSPFNRGSINSYKAFDTSKGVLYTYDIEENDPIVYDKTFLEKFGSIKFLK